MCACDASDPSLKDAAYNRSVRNLSMTLSHIYRFFRKPAFSGVLQLHHSMLKGIVYLDILSSLYSKLFHTIQVRVIQLQGVGCLKLSVCGDDTRVCWIPRREHTFFMTSLVSSTFDYCAILSYTISTYTSSMEKSCGTFN